MGSYLMLWIDPSGYTSYLAGKGTEQAYLDTDGVHGRGAWVLPGMIALTLVCALVSALVGRRLLKKQFEKAGAPHDRSRVPARSAGQACAASAVGLAVFLSPGLWFEALLMLLSVALGIALGKGRLALGMLGCTR